ncbi:MAG: hypothetical protein KKI20_05990 [Gammaproteobacteria bacterium]|nr:hypothetical protein [Gammaproteobacteria bacterium]
MFLNKSKEMEQIFEQIRSNKLKEVNLSGKCIPDHLKELAACLKDNGSVEKIDLSDNVLNPMDFAPLLEVLKTNKTVRELQLSKNALDQSVFESLIKDCALETLGLSDNPIYSTKNIETFKDLKTLKKLSIANCRLPLEEINALIEGLKTNNCLQYLDIEGNNIREIQDAKQIGEMLKTNTTLKTLRLTCMDGTLENMEEIFPIFANALEKNCALTSLEFCSTEDRGRHKDNCDLNTINRVLYRNSQLEDPTIFDFWENINKRKKKSALHAGVFTELCQFKN